MFTKQELSEKKPHNEEEEEIVEKKPLKLLLKETARNNWQLFFKIIELLLSVTCLAISYQPVKSLLAQGRFDLHYLSVVYLAFVGYILINLILIISLITKEKLPITLSVLFPFSGFCNYLTAGILLSVSRTTADKYEYFLHPNVYKITMLTWTIIISFIGSIVFAAEAAYTVIRYAKRT